MEHHTDFTSQFKSQSLNHTAHAYFTLQAEKTPRRHHALPRCITNLIAQKAQSPKSRFKSDSYEGTYGGGEDRPAKCWRGVSGGSCSSHVLLPCMGFRQVVRVGIDQVDSEKSWSCRTCRALPEYILVITVHLSALHQACKHTGEQSHPTGRLENSLTANDWQNMQKAAFKMKI